MLNEPKKISCCSKCGKPLTRLESIERGMGPICFGENYKKSTIKREKKTSSKSKRNIRRKKIIEKNGNKQLLLDVFMFDEETNKKRSEI